MVAGIVLAAGEGSRFGPEPKQLADLGGRPLLSWAFDAMASIDRVVVVLGARAGRVRDGVERARAPGIRVSDRDSRMDFVMNPDWAAGNSSSLRAGLRATPDAEAWIVTLGDQPFLPATVVDTFLARAGPGRATYDGVPGHPVRLDRPHAERVLQGEEPRAVLQTVPTIEVGHLFDPIDIDTPEDLEAARHEARAVLLR